MNFRAESTLHELKQKEQKDHFHLILSLVHSCFPSKKHTNTFCIIFICIKSQTPMHIDSQNLSLTILIFRAHTSRFTHHPILKTQNLHTSLAKKEDKKVFFSFLPSKQHFPSLKLYFFLGFLVTLF